MTGEPLADTGGLQLIIIVLTLVDVSGGAGCEGTIAHIICSTDDRTLYPNSFLDSTLNEYVCPVVRAVLT